MRQPPRVVGNLLHLHPREQFGEHGHHRLAVLEHVAHPAGRARIVLEHHELVRPGAHQVDADDVRVDPAGRSEADHLWQPGRVVAEQALGQAPAADNLLAVVKIVHEGVERAHALLDPAREPPPFGARDDARHHVERYQPLFGIVLAVDVEGDAGAAEEAFRLEALAAHPSGILFGQPLLVALIGRAHFATLGVHLIEILKVGRAHEPPVARQSMARLPYLCQVLHS